MQERLGNNEVERREWDIFSPENQEKFEKLQKKDPEGFELVKEYFDIRTEKDLSKEEFKERLLNFGNKIEAKIGENEKRMDKLSVFFQEITAKYPHKLKP